ncbi:MAG: hypothetical protein IKP95_11255 [Ruminococcus sp.]|nr:hypothetical protein [Ruminococcus sp.]
MAEQYTLEFTCKNGTTETVPGIVRLVFKKDRFAPGTELRGHILWEGAASDIVRIRLTVGSRLIHDGYLEYARQETGGGRPELSFSSRGWSVLLSQNEPVPGINYQVDLAALGALNTPIPNVTYESGTVTVNYISVKEHSTIWDAIGAYAMKAYSSQPYISGTNQVSVTGRAGQSRSYAASQLISAGTVCDRRAMLSKGYMEDYDGQYSVSLDNPAAAGTGIVREKYFSFDRQWLASLQMGLQLRLDHSNRRSDMSFITLLGYRGEELFDSYTLSLPGQTLSRSIEGIALVAENGRTATTLYTMN